ncbi:2-amino-4-hydroxy-6-hydroxymethyldihydropteridine diphosphokinase [candidate division WOR-3 bacterium]|nr:2-amino-4-hydroxy-6-hydroxymethyldihydropteridine diphosphokinase [candidate division WOR-3 bacterium]
MRFTAEVYLSVGSNKGWREFNHRLAVSALKTLPLILAESESSLYEEEFLGAEGPSILTSVLKVRTPLTPIALLSIISEIENKIGRDRLKRWSPRIIDIDIIDYNGWIYADNRLILPHPRFDSRPATVIAMLEINPDWKHPLKKRALSTCESNFKGCLFEKKIL